MSTSIIITRISVALFIGGIVGYERGNRNSAAGLRTHILVAVSMAMVSLIQLSMAEYVLGLVRQDPDTYLLYKVDIARLAAQALSGMGFIGAGTILHQKNTIVGLTTAASIWAVAVVGLAIGMGFYTLGVVGGVFIFLTLDTLSHFQARYIERMYEVQIDISFKKNEDVPEQILHFMQTNNLEISGVEYNESKENSQETIKYFLNVSHNKNMERIIKEMYYIHPAVTSVEKYGR